MKRLAGFLLVAILGGLISVGVYKMFGSEEPQKIYIQEDSMPTYPANYPSKMAPMNVDFVEVAEKTVNSVVHIRTEYERKSNLYDYFFDWEDFFGGQQHNGSRPIVAYGSGVIIGPAGYIVTNNHVVQDADFIEITLDDKRTYEATIVGTDPTTDLALIKVKDEEEFPYLNYGNSDDLKIGEWVLAVGNPFNLTSTVTAGIVSAKARNINILVNPQGTSIESFIQTDAAVNRGNSGGALVNTNGELIGVNAAIASGNGFFTGYSFAIPVNIVKKVVADIIEYGTVQRAYIGVSIRELDSKFAKENDIDDLNGVYVAGVMKDGAAEQAGIKEGDIILKVNNHKVNHTSELLERIGQQRPGDEVELLVRRNDDEKLMHVTLKNRQGTTKVVAATSDDDYVRMMGADLRPVDKDDMERLGIGHGLKVTNIQSGKLSEAGIRNNFVITHVNNKAVGSINDLKEALKGKKGGVLLEGIYTNGVRAYYAFGL